MSRDVAGSDDVSEVDADACRESVRFRKLQIAWSVAWGVVAVLLVALWVRSYWCDDTLFLMTRDDKTFAIASDRDAIRASGQGNACSVLLVVDYYLWIDNAD